MALAAICQVKACRLSGDGKMPATDPASGGTAKLSPPEACSHNITLTKIILNSYLKHHIMQISTDFRHIMVVAALLAAMIPATAATFTVDGINYSVDDYDHATVTGYTSALPKSVTIPYVVSYQDGDNNYMFFVNVIAANAFVGSGITELTFARQPYEIPDKYDDLTIEEGAFDVPTLQSINIDREDVPRVAPAAEIFNAGLYDTARLIYGTNLTAAQVDAYRQAYPWDKFRDNGPTAISTPAAATDPCVTVSRGAISITGDAEVSVHTPAGRLLYRGHGPRTLTPSPGLYIISTPTHTLRLAL